MFFKSADDRLNSIQEEIDKAINERDDILKKGKKCILTADEVARVKGLNFRVYGYYQDIEYTKWEKTHQDFIMALQNALLAQCEIRENMKISDVAMVSFVANQQADTARFKLNGISYVVCRKMLWRFTNKYKYKMGVDTISIDIC